MEKITANKTWSIYSEHVGMTSTKYWVMDDQMSQDIGFVNDEFKANKVCDALNKASLEESKALSYRELLIKFSEFSNNYHIEGNLENTVDSFLRSELD